MKYFKIKYGFENQEFIRVEEDELEKAIYSQISGKVGVFKNGTCRGSNIISITPDYHKAMGWNDGYELKAEDFDDINRSPVKKEYQNCLETAKDNVSMLISQKKEHLIGNSNIKQLT